MRRLDRISAILVQLQSRSVVRAAEMAARFGVSMRTIYRDVRSLEAAGVPVCGDAGVGYSLVEGYRLPPLMFTAGEATALLTAEKFVEQFTDPHNAALFHRGMDKVRAVMRGTAAEKLDGVTGSIAVHRSRRAPAEVRPGLLQTILGSIGERRILAMDYTGADDVPSRREVEAVGVTFSNPFWYLTAWCHLRGEYRTFRFDRIDALEPTDRPHTIAEHPPLAELVGRDDHSCLTRVVVRTSAETARLYRDADYMLGLVEERELEDGRVEQVFMTYSTEAMARRVLARADTTEVTEPAEVRELIAKIIDTWMQNSSR